MTEEKRDPLVKRLESIAASVESRDRATLAKLRRSLSEEVPFEALRVVMPYVRGADEYVARREDDAALLAGLFALHPESHSRSLATALRSAAEKSDSVELRFRAMFSASREDLAPHLRSAVTLVASHDGLGINWDDLYTTIRFWNASNNDPRRDVRRKWARDFWGSPPNTTASDDDADGSVTNDSAASKAKGK